MHFRLQLSAETQANTDEKACLCRNMDLLPAALLSVHTRSVAFSGLMCTRLEQTVPEECLWQEYEAHRVTGSDSTREYRGPKEPLTGHH